MSAQPGEPRLSLVIPCYNEAACLEATAAGLVRVFHSEGVAIELLLVDNGSTDDTAARITELIDRGWPVRLVQVPVNRGKGYGVLQGLQAATGAWVGLFDADGPIAAADVLRVFATAEAARRPVLVMVRRRFRLDGWKRQFFTWAFNALANVLFGGLGTFDINANPKVWPRAALPALTLASHDWFLDSELVIKARRIGLEVLEVNALAQVRAAGKSHVVNWRAAASTFGSLVRFRFTA
ncbi:MAG: glycosyltransferase family 2 protein [Pirellulales bacterium]|nr:glycosyltransferase family 2 protein [Pirellulales bacterium]